ncbi:hypothetical protein HDU67_006926 [Dinochytrium kinnereticum]|nr:hypothetical protein HDU67_006926 [Dinochytrium kinnereticum]
MRSGSYTAGRLPVFSRKPFTLNTSTPCPKLSHPTLPECVNKPLPPVFSDLTSDDDDDDDDDDEEEEEEDEEEEDPGMDSASTLGMG